MNCITVTYIGPVLEMRFPPGVEYDSVKSLEWQSITIPFQYFLKVPDPLIKPPDKDEEKLLYVRLPEYINSDFKLWLGSKNEITAKTWALTLDS